MRSRQTCKLISNFTGIKLAPLRISPVLKFQPTGGSIPMINKTETNFIRRTALAAHLSVRRLATGYAKHVAMAVTPKTETYKLNILIYYLLVVDECSLRAHQTTITDSIVFPIFFFFVFVSFFLARLRRRVVRLLLHWHRSQI